MGGTIEDAARSLSLQKQGLYAIIATIGFRLRGIALSADGGGIIPIGAVALSR